MNHFFVTTLVTALISLTPPLVADDRGRDALTQLTVKVFYATDDDPAAAGPKAQALTADKIEKFKAHEKFQFDHYRILGKDIKPLYRSYENWAQPIRGSDEILCRFETSQILEDDALRIDLELWISRKKTLKTNLRLNPDKPIFILGPAWRKGRLIITVEMNPKPNS